MRPRLSEALEPLIEPLIGPNVTSLQRATSHSLGVLEPFDANATFEPWHANATSRAAAEIAEVPWHANATSRAAAEIAEVELLSRAPPADDLPSYFVRLLVEERPLWLIGIASMMLATLSSACGLLLFKRQAEDGRPWYANPSFWGGFLLLVVNASVLDLLAFAVTPLSIIAPFAGLTIVFSVLLVYVGCCGVREAPRGSTLAAVGVIVVGVTLAACFGPHSNRGVTPADMALLMARHAPLFVFAASGLPALLVLLPASRFGGARWREVLSSPLGSLTLALAAAAYGSVVQILFKAFATALVAFVQTGSWPYASGAEAALQNACAISSATGQIGFLNIAIGESPVTYAVPAYQSALLLGTLVLAGAVLGEFDALPHHALISFGGGCACVLLGLAGNALSLRRSGSGARADEKEEKTVVESAAAARVWGRADV